MSDKKILLIVPTRDRPHNIPRVIESWRNTTSGLSHLMILYDFDQINNYKSILEEYRNDVVTGISPRLKLCPKLNNIANVYKDPYDIIGFIGDDIVLKTPGWEERVIESCGEVGMCYPNDTIQGGALPTHIFMTSNIIKTLGYMVPPNFVHLYCDNFWLHLGTYTKTLKYMPDVIMEHYHPHVGKAPTDNQYQKTYAEIGRDAREYQSWIDNQAQKDIEKILKLKNNTGNPHI